MTRFVLPFLQFAVHAKDNKNRKLHEMQFQGGDEHEERFHCYFKYSLLHPFDSKKKERRKKSLLIRSYSPVNCANVNGLTSSLFQSFMMNSFFFQIDFYSISEWNCTKYINRIGIKEKILFVNYVHFRFGSWEQNLFNKISQ